MTGQVGGKEPFAEGRKGLQHQLGGRWEEFRGPVRQADFWTCALKSAAHRLSGRFAPGLGGTICWQSWRPRKESEGMELFERLARTFHLSIGVFDLVAISVLLILALALGLVLTRILHRYARKREGTWEELVFSFSETLPLPLLLLGVLYAALQQFKLPSAWERLGSKLILILVLLLLFYFPTRIFILFLRRLEEKEPTLERVTEPASFIVRVLFAVVAFIIILENLDIHLTAVWTTLGVGSVAVALALQDTLGNFFAGLYLIADRPIRLDDYVKLDSGQEGYVVAIGWRSTQLRTNANNMVVVPNATLAKAIVTNYSLPELRVSLSITVSVSSAADPVRVERLLLEIAQQAIQDDLAGLLAQPEPVARFIPGFGPSSLDFTLYVQVNGFADQFPVQSELRKRILARFQKEGIEMPFPTQTIIFQRPATEDSEKSRPTAQSPVGRDARSGEGSHR
jgi:small-conductance mechanosensitive channel